MTTVLVKERLDHGCSELDRDALRQIGWNLPLKLDLFLGLVVCVRDGAVGDTEAVHHPVGRRQK